MPPKLFYFEESFASSLRCVCSLTVCADTRLTEAAGPHLQTDGVRNIHEALRKTFPVRAHSLSLAHSVSAAALKDDLVIGTVRTTAIHKQTVRSHSPPAVSASTLSSLCFSFFNYPRCLPTSGNVFSIWGQLFTSSGFVPKQEKHRNRELSILYSLHFFPPSLHCQRPVRPSPPSPPGRHIMHSHTFCVCLWVSGQMCVYVIRQLRNNGFNLPAARSKKKAEWWDRWREGDQTSRPWGQQDRQTPSGDITSHDLITPPLFFLGPIKSSPWRL